MRLSALLQFEVLDQIAPRERHREHVLNRLRAFEFQSNHSFYDEEVYTLLFVYGFVSQGQKANATLFKTLTEGSLAPEGLKVWLEMLTIPPRRGSQGESEGNSQIDLMLGSLEGRAATASGVRYSQPPSGKGSICFVESKWLSDIDIKTTHDPHRNQWIRVIESALTFQNERGELPDEVHVTLLTPGIFRDGDYASRFYYYKYQEYKEDLLCILRELEGAKVQPRAQRDWKYPKLETRLPCLSLHWISFEEMFKAMPGSDYKDELRRFLKSADNLLINL